MSAPSFSEAAVIGDASGETAARGWLARLGTAALVLLAFSLPFEFRNLTLALGPISVTNLELLLLSALILTGAAVIAERRWRRPGWLAIPRVWLLLWALFAVALLLSAALAPANTGNALKAAGRTITGIALALAVPQLVRRGRDFRWIAAGLLAGGLLAATIGLLELGAGRPLAWLEPVRQQATTVGPYLRLAGTFNHANQAGMYFEATLPLLVAAAYTAALSGRRILAWALGAAVLLYLAADVLTYSRASFVTAIASLSAVAALATVGRSREARRPAWLFLAAAGSMLILVAANTLLSPVQRLRLSTEDDRSWYLAKMDVPPLLELAAGARQIVTVGLHNQGTLVWASEGSTPIHVGARIYPAGAEADEVTEMRWLLPKPLEPGDSATAEVILIAPEEPGEYWIDWDLVQENVVWFSARTGVVHRTAFLVGAAGGETGLSELDSADWLTLQAPIPDRRTLWRVAAVELGRRPAFGLGLDNFRLTYGRELGWTEWDQTIHSNNWYIETLVSTGLLGSLPFFAWIALLALALVRRLRGAGPDIWSMALAAGLLAFMIHGLLDYFLLFNGTGLLFWLLTGLWVATGRMAAGAGE